MIQVLQVNARCGSNRGRQARLARATSMGAILEVEVLPKLTMANEAKRNCVRVTERGEEAWSETATR